MRNLGFFGIIIIFIIQIGLLAGYVINIVKFVQLDFKAPVKAEVIRGVGVATGAGAIVGYIKIRD